MLIEYAMSVSLRKEFYLLFLQLNFNFTTLFFQVIFLTFRGGNPQ